MANAREMKAQHVMRKILGSAIFAFLLTAGFATSVSARNLHMYITNDTSKTLYWWGDTIGEGGISEFPSTILPGKQGEVRATHKDGHGDGGFKFGDVPATEASTYTIKVSLEYKYELNSVTQNCDNKHFTPTGTGCSFSKDQCKGSGNCSCYFTAK